MPRQGEVLNRTPISLPDTPPGAVELAEMVSDADKTFHEAGLKKLGVSDKLIERIRNLDSLAPSSGSFIALSLEKTHRSYYLQLMELMEMAQDLRARLMAKAGEPGYIGDDKARAFFNKNYIEMVKEAGRGFELMLGGAQAFVKMLMDTNGENAGGNGGATKKKPGWRKVTPLDANAKTGA